ncbi:hypothetical protein ACFV1N_47980 [Streptosporangium canum]|uniref:hypothetical protein n=1 Tax=Streptosporangium canum TaxID=324952 RepID=UPI0036AD844E
MLDKPFAFTDLQLKTAVECVADALTAYREARIQFAAARLWQRPTRRRQLREAGLMWEAAREVLIAIVQITAVDVDDAERTADGLVAGYMVHGHQPIVCPVVHRS